MRVLAPLLLARRTLTVADASHRSVPVTIFAPRVQHIEGESGQIIAFKGRTDSYQGACKLTAFVEAVTLSPSTAEAHALRAHPLAFWMTSAWCPSPQAPAQAGRPKRSRNLAAIARAEREIGLRTKRAMEAELRLESELERVKAAGERMAGGEHGEELSRSSATAWSLEGPTAVSTARPAVAAPSASLTSDAAKPAAAATTTTTGAGRVGARRGVPYCDYL